LLKDNRVKKCKEDVVNMSSESTMTFADQLWMKGATISDIHYAGRDTLAVTYQSCSDGMPKEKRILVDYSGSIELKDILSSMRSMFTLVLKE
jgi:hypothetical protein